MERADTITIAGLALESSTFASQVENIKLAMCGKVSEELMEEMKTLEIKAKALSMRMWGITD